MKQAQGKPFKLVLSPETLAALAKLPPGHGRCPKPMTPEEMVAAYNYMKAQGWSGPAYPPQGTTISLVPKPNKPGQD